MSGLAQQAVPGSLVDFRDGDGIRAGVVIAEEKGKLVVVDARGRTERIPHSRVALCLTAAGGVPDAAGAARRAGEHERIAGSLAADVDIASAWDLLVDDPRGLELRELAELTLGRSDGGACGGVLRALLADRASFQRKDDLWVPRGREALAEIRHQREREAARAAARERFVARVRAALQEPRAPQARSRAGESLAPRESLDADERELLDSLVALAVHGASAPDAREGIRIVGEIRSVPGQAPPVPSSTLETAAFQAGEALGVFTPDENLFLRRFGIRLEFPAGVLSEAARLAQAAHLAQVPHAGAFAEPGRMDLTALDVFTVDDELTEDLDDALSIEADGESAVRIGVHVADPAALIIPGSAVDEEASLRGTSHYLPERRIPMLPPVLSEDACSLRPGQVRPALSFLCRVGFDGEVSDARIVPSRVRSRGRFSYDEVDALLARGRESGADALGGGADAPARTSGDGGFPAPEVVLLERAAAALEARRREQGATPIAAPEVEARPHPDGTIELIRSEADRPARALVAEMMVLAGRLAAEGAIAAGVPVLFRRQAPPDEPVTIPPLSPYDPVAVRRARRAMRRGEVGPRPGPHAALGLKAYAQATSPLRRYQDFVTHRQLRAVVGGQPPPYDLESLQRIAATYEEQERGSRQAERGSRDYWMLRWLEQEKRRAAPEPLRVQGAITGIEARGRTDIELCETLFVSSVPRRPGHAPGQVLELLVEQVNPRAGTLLLREE